METTMIRPVDSLEDVWEQDLVCEHARPRRCKQPARWRVVCKHCRRARLMCEYHWDRVRRTAKLYCKCGAYSDTGYYPLLSAFRL